MTIEQSINRLEQTVEKLHRPILEGNKMLTKAHNFIKHGEKSLSSNDGTGSLVLRKPEITEVLTKPNAPTFFRQIAGNTTINSDHLEIVKHFGNSYSGWAS